MKNIFIYPILIVFLISSNFALLGQEEKKETPDGEVSVTQHTARIGGKNISYTATAGTLQLRDEEDNPIALYGFTAYTKNDESDLTQRPITFAYNGGPGSSSMWLHMGVLGPKRVVVTDPGFTPAAPYKVEVNEHSILDVSDLVMIDPVGTGLSKAIGKAENKDFWGVNEDIRSVSLFIKQYINENDRWHSPKFLLGESYGTLRNAGVMNYLQGRLGISMNGVIMVSAVFDLRTLTFQPGDDISYVANLPTYSAVAWYHDKVKNKPELKAFLEESRLFAKTEYTLALMKGDQITDTELKKILPKLARFTGLSEEYLRRAKLRVTEPEFAQELLREEGKTVGRLDGRFTGINQDLLSQTADYDPQSTSISPGYITAFSDYFYRELKVNKKHYYHTSAYARQGFNWNWQRGGSRGFPRSVNTGIDMAEAMTQNPNMKVLIMNGLYDIATPFFGVEYSIDHLELEPEIKKNIIMTYYEAGHMMYTHQASLEAFKRDFVGFVEGR
ncbi:MAG: carboxypeptidase [Bacteroidia bacterium]